MFWVYRSGDEAQAHPKSTLDVQFIEADGKARFTRKVELDHRGWKQVSLPLAWFRWGEGRSPRWDQVARLGFSFRDPARVWLDNVGTVAGDAAHGAELTTDQLREVAFPGRPASEVRVVERAKVCLLTDAPELNVDELVSHLAKVSAAVYRDLPQLVPPAEAPRLIVFRTRETYAAFPPRLAERLGGVIAAPPRSDGFTMLGIATSSWDAARGSLQTVYTHEFVHATLGRSLLLDNRGEWLHEGLASTYQLRFHPQADFANIVSQGLADRIDGRRWKRSAAARRQLRSMRTGKGQPWWGLLAPGDRYRDGFPKLLEEFKKSGSTDLGPHLNTLFKVSWDDLTADWIAYCRKTWTGQ